MTANRFNLNFQNANEWVSQTFGKNYSQLVMSVRHERDVAPILRKLERRIHEELGVPQDLTAALAIHSLAYHYTYNSTDTPISDLVIRDTRKEAYLISETRADSPSGISSGENQERDWYLAQEQLANRMALPNII